MTDFTKGEAQALVGRRIRTNAPFSGVPAGTTGRVVRADGYPALGGHYDVGIEWDLPGRTKPLVDWFSREEYERYLLEIPTEGDAP